MDKDIALRDESKKLRRHSEDIHKHLKILRNELHNARALLAAAEHYCRVISERQQRTTARRRR